MAIGIILNQREEKTIKTIPLYIINGSNSNWNNKVFRKLEYIPKDYRNYVLKLDAKLIENKLALKNIEVAVAYFNNDKDPGNLIDSKKVKLKRNSKHLKFYQFICPYKI